MKAARAGRNRLPRCFPRHEEERGTTQHPAVSTLAPAAPAERWPPSTHPLVDVVPAGLILLLHALLQEVDAQLEAEVLLLQVIEVLGQSAISIRHGGQPMGRSTCPAAPLSPGTWCSCTAA